MSRGRKILERQQFLPIPSSENKCIKIELFMVFVFCDLVSLGQHSYPSFKRLSTPTRKHSYLNIIDCSLAVALYVSLTGDAKNVSRPGALHNCRSFFNIYRSSHL